MASNNRMISTKVRCVVLLAFFSGLSVNATLDRTLETWWDADDCWPSITPDMLCFGQRPTETQLYFEGSTVTENELHNGGVLRFDDIGTVRGRTIDLVVSVVPGTDYYTHKARKKNGIYKNFGRISLGPVRGDPDSGEGNFRFCLHDHETGELTVADSFRWSIFDIDEQNYSGHNLKEKVTLLVTQAVDYYLYPDLEKTEIVTTCEKSGFPSPCPLNERTVFHSSTKGSNNDDPTDPDVLTERQKKRSVVFAFKDTDCFDVTFDNYCAAEEETGSACQTYRKTNFYFSGGGLQVVNSGECVVTNPTDAPTDVPSRWPTIAPTSSRTESPSDSPSDSPSEFPIERLSVTPSESPTEEPTEEPSDTPSESPKEHPSESPSNSPTVSLVPPPDCPTDIVVTETDGVTEFPPVNVTSAVEILSKDTTTVTVALHQVWENTSGDNISSIYYQWEPDPFGWECLHATEVPPRETYAEITLYCSILVPVARMAICLAEPLESGFLKPGDNATIPNCCRKGEDVDTPAVCYTIGVQCAPGCPEDDSQVVRHLRRVAKAEHRIWGGGEGTTLP